MGLTFGSPRAGRQWEVGIHATGTLRQRPSYHRRPLYNPPHFVESNLVNLTPQQSLRDVVLNNPAAAGVFEKLGVDYSRRGGRELADVLHESGISLEDFIAEIEQVVRLATGNPPATDWRLVPLRKLIRHIVSTHHNYLRVELPALDKWIGRISGQHPDERELLLSLQRAIQGFQRNVEVQITKEEAILFPAISNLEAAVMSGATPSELLFGSVANLSRAMEQENDEAGRALQEIRLLTNSYTCPPEGSAALRNLFQRLRNLAAQGHQHLHLENNILLPRAIALEKGVTPCN
jgi:regulator of cell morphogenesis and NO signaling